MVICCEAPGVVSGVASKKLFPWHRAENEESSEFRMQGPSANNHGERERTPEFIQ